MSGARTNRGALLAAGAALCVLSYACGNDYLHTNPYDPAFPVTMTLEGPDTLFNLGEVGTYTVHTSPAFPDTAITFAASDTFEFVPSGPGNFESKAPPLWPATVQVAAYAYIGMTDTTISRSEGGATVTIQTKIPRHSAFKNVILTQKVTKLSLRCPDTNACDTLSAGNTWSVWADGFDAHGLRVYAFFSSTANPSTGPAFVTYTVRDTTIASASAVGIRVATVTARRTGTTWIVAARDALRDSLKLVVR